MTQQNQNHDPHDHHDPPANITEKYMRLRAIADDPRKTANQHERDNAQRIAARLEDKHPTLRTIYQRAQLRAEEMRTRESVRREASQAAATGQTPDWINERRSPTVDELIGLYATFVQVDGPDPTTGIMSRLVQSAAGWVHQRLTLAADTDIEAQVDLLLDEAFSTIRQGDPMPTLKTRFNDEIALDIDDLEDADTNDPLYAIHIELPVSLWEQILARTNGGDLLCEWISSAMDETDDDDEDEDDEDD